MIEEIVKKFESREANIGVVGLGYVGLPLGVFFAEAGFTVSGFDTDEKKRDFLRQGQSYIDDVSTESLKNIVEGRAKGKFNVISNFSEMSACDAIILCVPTPLAKTKDPDVSYIVKATRLVSAILQPGQLVVLESTTYPGTTREVVLPLLEEGETVREVGKDFYLAYSPERVDPGNPKFDTKNTPKVIGGMTADCCRAAEAMYSGIVDETVPVTCPEAAEMTKLLENTFRLINIGLVNEFAIMCKRLNVDVWEVIDAAATKPFGFIPFYPGPGLGGHCIPVDPHYLSWKLRLRNYRDRFIQLASEVNSMMPKVVVERVSEALNSAKKSVNGSTIGIIGVAYKRDISDMRESPAYDIVSLLHGMGANISYHDPFVPKFRLADDLEVESAAMTKQWLEACDCCVVVTDHSELNFEDIAKHSQLIVDTRNALVRHGVEQVAGEKLRKL